MHPKIWKLYRNYKYCFALASLSFCFNFFQVSEPVNWPSLSNTSPKPSPYFVSCLLHQKYAHIVFPFVKKLSNAFSSPFKRNLIVTSVMLIFINPSTESIRPSATFSSLSSSVVSIASTAFSKQYTVFAMLKLLSKSFHCVNSDWFTDIKLHSYKLHHKNNYNHKPLDWTQSLYLKNSLLIVADFIFITMRTSLSNY